MTDTTNDQDCSATACPCPKIRLTRRSSMTQAALVGGAVALAGCSTYDTSVDAPDKEEVAAGTVLASTADVPVGGGLILEDQQVVLTQPADGEFKAFNAICTHQGCVVADVTDGTINCTCHGSSFSIEDGSVTAGPAPSGLPEEAITVDGDQILLGEGAAAPAEETTDAEKPEESAETEAAGGAAGLTAVADVPVGAGVVLAEAGLVVTQPTKGEFKAFTATCTHQGCTVAGVSGGTINCTCHGSSFDISDGSVVGGPAPSPLAETAVKVEGDQVVLS